MSRGVLGVLAGRGRRLHHLRVRKLGEETSFQILPALVILPPVDEHFVLRDEKEEEEGEILDTAATQTCDWLLYNDLLLHFCRRSFMCQSSSVDSSPAACWVAHRHSNSAGCIITTSNLFQKIDLLHAYIDIGRNSYSSPLCFSDLLLHDISHTARPRAPVLHRISIPQLIKGTAVMKYA